MARFPGNEVLYNVFQDFLNLCVTNNQSLLWPDSEIWTPENVSNVKKRMVDGPIMGNNLSFEEKLQKQMTNASPELWGIIADIYYIYFLPSTFIKYETKRRDIEWAAEQGALVPPPQNASIWEAQKTGFTRTGQRYHLKYAQFWLILYFANHVKGLQDPGALVADYSELQKTLDNIIENIPNRSDRAYDMRHAILYMTYPDLFERIISTSDKENILNTYKKNISGPVPIDHDEAIRRIRKTLSVKYDKPDRPFDFYRDLKQDAWRPKKKMPKGTATVETETGVVTVPPEDSTVLEDSDIKEHTKIQWILLKLGNDMGLDVWVAKNDRNRGVAGQKFTDLPHLKKDIPLTFDEVSNKTIQMIDVVWLKGNEIKAAFEIESTTSIYSGILRLADLIAMQPNINIPLYIVAPVERRSKVIAEINRPVFSRLPKPMSSICRFISFSSLHDRIPQIESVLRYIKPDYIDELSETCEVQEEE